MKKCTLFFLLIASIALNVPGSEVAVPAPSPSAYIDYNSKTSAIETILNNVSRGNLYFISVNFNNVRSLHSYSIKITYNPSVVRFDGAQKSLSPDQPSFLESRGGEVAAFLTIPQKGSVEIAATQVGKNSSVTARGSGVGAYLKFTALSSGDPKIKIVLIMLVDENGVVDTIR